LRWRARWDGLWGHILTANQAWTLLEIHKVKAHQTLTADTPPHLVPHVIGNMIADQVANKTVDYYLPRVLPSAADVRAIVRGPLQQRIDRLLSLRQALPAVPKPATFGVFARRRTIVPPAGPMHALKWSGRGARCTECYKLFRTCRGWDSSCPGAPAASVGFFEQAKGKRHNLATFAMAGRQAGLLIACLRCACFSQVHVCKLNHPCSGNVGTRGTYLRRLLASRHPTDPGTYVQHVLRPWPRATKNQLASLSIPDSFLAPAPPCLASGGLASSPGPSGSSDAAAAVPPAGCPAAAGAGPADCRPLPACAASPAASLAACDAAGAGLCDVPPAEEWDLSLLAEWFGDTGL
jgi:hypothetical protein